MDLQSKFLDNKYTKVYFQIINRALSENRLVSSFIYYERHHILLKSIYPAYKSLKQFEWNGVLLTAREHFICHKLLMKMFDDKNHQLKMRRGFIQMSMGRAGKLFSRHFEEARNARMGTGHSDETKKKISDMKMGIPLSESHREALAKRSYMYNDDRNKNVSDALKGRTLTDDHKENIRKNNRAKEFGWASSLANKGKVFSDDHKTNLSLSKKGRIMITKDGKNKYIKREQLESFMVDGWNSKMAVKF